MLVCERVLRAHCGQEMRDIQRLVSAYRNGPWLRLQIRGADGWHVILNLDDFSRFEQSGITEMRRISSRHPSNQNHKKGEPVLPGGTLGVPDDCCSLPPGRSFGAKTEVPWRNIDRVGTDFLRARKPHYADRERQACRYWRFCTMSRALARRWPGTVDGVAGAVRPGGRQDRNRSRDCGPSDASPPKRIIGKTPDKASAREGSLMLGNRSAEVAVA